MPCPFTLCLAVIGGCCEIYLPLVPLQLPTPATLLPQLCCSATTTVPPYLPCPSQDIPFPFPATFYTHLQVLPILYVPIAVGGGICWNFGGHGILQCVLIVYSSYSPLPLCIYIPMEHSSTTLCVRAFPKVCFPCLPHYLTGFCCHFYPLPYLPSGGLDIYCMHAASHLSSTTTFLPSTCMPISPLPAMPAFIIPIWAIPSHHAPSCPISHLPV